MQIVFDSTFQQCLVSVPSSTLRTHGVWHLGQLLFLQMPPARTEELVTATQNSTATDLCNSFDAIVKLPCITNQCFISKDGVSGRLEVDHETCANDVVGAMGIATDIRVILNITIGVVDLHL